ncbi:MAG: maleylpyruvate isomerase family mycothiol-dependent enzyme [Chloroflexota bacterium]|nr:maleylpyruvate isomerase family mycothiol-dependent enzyme [Chloroflexota bacterium]MDE2885864.1 maleylpyruvate isomerase family mycothiol-dependent enzyme [Chloroflexota bacterium]
MSRTAYRRAVASFLETAGKVQPEQWGSPALGIWSVRDLVGHTSRSITRVEQFGVQRAPSVDITSAVHHYRRSLRQPSDDQRVAERGIAAGQELGDDPLAMMNADWARTEQVLDATGDDTIIAYDNGGIRFVDYLETRVFELTVHTLDLANAIGVPVEPSREAMGVTLQLLAALALESGRGAPLALSGTGRGPLPDGYSVLG